jgi:flagellar biogenesis protein FliO
MSDPSVERDLADMLLGSERVAEKEPFNAFEESAKLRADAPSDESDLSGSSEEQQIIAEEPAKAAAGLAAVAAAARGDGTDGETNGDEAAETALVPPPIKPSEGLGRPVRIAAGFGLLALGIFGFLAWRRRQTPMEEAFGLKVVSRAKLDQKSSVAVLEVGGAVLIVGLSDQGPRLLARLDDGRVMDGDADEEVDRLRALVGQNPADRLGAWVNAAQSGREDEVSASPAVAFVDAATPPNERVDLQRRLAEIRRVCSD